MSDVNVTTLRQHLPEYLAKVARGERLSVTLRGRLKGSLLRYDQPFEPVLPADDWDMNR